jgi:mRNA interferase RelE/StbE
MRFTFTESARKDVIKLSRLEQARLKKKLIYWQALPSPLVQAKPLTNHEASHRFRFGAYRILVKLNGQELLILRIRHRKDVYKH